MGIRLSISSVGWTIATVSGILAIGNFVFTQNQLVYLLCVALLFVVCYSLHQNEAIRVPAERPTAPMELSPVLKCPESIRSLCYESMETKKLGSSERRERLTVERSIHEKEKK